MPGTGLIDLILTEGPCWKPPDDPPLTWEEMKKTTANSLAEKDVTKSEPGLELLASVLLCTKASDAIPPAGCILNRLLAAQEVCCFCEHKERAICWVLLKGACVTVSG